MRSFLRAGLVLGVLTAACKDSVGPKSLADPAVTTAQLASLDTLFDITTLESFSALSPDIGPTPASAMSRALALAASANPLSGHTALRPYVGRIEAARTMTRFAPSMSSATSAAILPPEVVGKTFEWNLTSVQYEPTARTGAPSVGVRFILYAIDPLTGLPADPLVEVGYVDLIDESSGGTDKLHVSVAGTGGAPVYVDYTVTLASLSSSAARITTAGYITNGAASPDTLRFTGTIDVAGSASSVAVTQNVALDVNSHDIHIRNFERITLTETTFSLRISFRFEHGGEVVTLDGTLDVDESTQTANGTTTIRVDGGLFATCTTEASPGSFSQVCQGGDADGLSAGEVEAIEAMGNAIAKVTEIFTGLFGPPLGFLGAGA
jgi:hypothetical protein